MKTVYIIHGWGGSPEEPLHAWLKSELEQRGYAVVAPEMPNTDAPHIDAWLSKLNEVIEPSEDAVLVGHSIGCQAILRYLASAPEGPTVGKVVLLAPWMHLDEATIAEEGEAARAIAQEWHAAPLSFDAVKAHVAGPIIAIFSDNDPFVPLSEKEIFVEKLGAEIIVEHNKGHFDLESGISELPSLLVAIEQ